MKDLVRIFQLEDEAEELLQKIKRVTKHNEDKGVIGREGMYEQIETRIRIWRERRKEVLEELEELKRED